MLLCEKHKNLNIDMSYVFNGNFNLKYFARGKYLRLNEHFMSVLILLVVCILAATQCVQYFGIFLMVQSSCWQSQHSQ